MEETKNIMKKTSIPSTLLPIGVILMVFGIITLTINNQNNNYIEIESIVTKIELLEEAHYDIDNHYIDAKYTVYVKYKVKNIEYIEGIRGLNKHKKGDKIKIYYNPEEPSQITTQEKNILFPIVVIIGGFVLFVVGIISAVISYKKIKSI